MDVRKVVRTSLKLFSNARDWLEILRKPLPALFWSRQKSFYTFSYCQKSSGNLRKSLEIFFRNLPQSLEAACKSSEIQNLWRRKISHFTEKKLAGIQFNYIFEKKNWKNADKIVVSDLPWKSFLQKIIPLRYMENLKCFIFFISLNLLWFLVFKISLPVSNIHVQYTQTESVHLRHLAIRLNSHGINPHYQKSRSVK